jgi:hypothetical protein
MSRRAIGSTRLQQMHSQVSQVATDGAFDKTKQGILSGRYPYSTYSTYWTLLPSPFLS